MIQTKASYDFVMKNITQEDAKQFVYIFELGKKAQVVFTNSQLYLAVSVLRSKIWFPVNRETLTDNPLPPIPAQKAHLSKFSEKISRALEGHSSPTPPYRSHIGWPPDKGADTSVFEEKHSKQSSNGQDDIKDKPKNASENNSATLSGKAAGTNELPEDQKNTPVRKKKIRRYHDPVTGDSSVEKKPGYIYTSSYYSRKLVKAEPNGKSSEKTPGFISKNTAKGRRLVDRDSGKSILPGTDDGIPYHVYRRTRLVDPLTGDNADANTLNPISKARFQKNGYRDPDFGGRVKRLTPGAIPAAAYENLLANRNS
jgi:hypothetical protein